MQKLNLSILDLKNGNSFLFWWWNGLEFINEDMS